MPTLLLHGLGLGVEIVEDRLRVRHHLRAVDRRDQSEDAVTLRSWRDERAGIDRCDWARAVEQVWQHGDVAVRRQPLRHPLQIGTHGHRVHVHDDGRPLAGAGWLEHIGIHHAIGGTKIDARFRYVHEAALPEEVSFCARLRAMRRSMTSLAIVLLLFVVQVFTQQAPAPERRGARAGPTRIDKVKDGLYVVRGPFVPCGTRGCRPTAPTTA